MSEDDVEVPKELEELLDELTSDDPVIWPYVIGALLVGCIFAAGLAAWLA